MAFICCLECKNSFSEFAQECPFCGYPTADMKDQIATNKEILIMKRNELGKYKYSLQPHEVRDEICHVLELLGRIPTNELGDLSSIIAAQDNDSIRRAISNLKNRFIIRVEKDSRTKIEYLSLIPSDERKACAKERSAQKKEKELEKKRQIEQMAEERRRREEDRKRREQEYWRERLEMDREYANCVSDFILASKTKKQRTKV